MDGWPDFKKSLGVWPLAWGTGQVALRQVCYIAAAPYRWIRRNL